MLLRVVAEAITNAVSHRVLIPAEGRASARPGHAEACPSEKRPVHFSLTALVGPWLRPRLQNGAGKVNFPSTPHADSSPRARAAIARYRDCTPPTARQGRSLARAVFCWSVEDRSSNFHAPVPAEPLRLC